MYQHLVKSVFKNHLYEIVAGYQKRSSCQLEPLMYPEFRSDVCKICKPRAFVLQLQL